MTTRCFAVLLALLVGLAGAGAGHAQGVNAANLAQVELHDGTIFERQSGGIWTTNAPQGSPVAGAVWTSAGARYFADGIHLPRQGVAGAYLNIELGGANAASYYRPDDRGVIDVTVLSPILVAMTDFDLVVRASLRFGAPMPYEGCDTLPGRVSAQSGQAVTLTVDNRSGGRRQFAWVGFDGSQRMFLDLPPGAVQTQQTFVGHVWLVHDPVTDRCTEVRVVQPGAARFELVAPSQ